jgi:hypothetical protein
MVNKTKSDVVVQIVAESAKTVDYAIPVAKLSVLDTALEDFFKASQMIADAGQVMASLLVLLLICSAKSLTMSIGWLLASL